MLSPLLRRGCLTAAAVLAALATDTLDAAKRTRATIAAPTQARSSPVADYPSSTRRPRGIYAVVEKVSTNTIILKIAENVKVKFGKGYIAAVRQTADED